jgi:hypothetical protein
VCWDEYVTSKPEEICKVVARDLVEPMMPGPQKPGLFKRAMAKLAGRPSRKSMQKVLEGATPMNGAIFSLMPSIIEHDTDIGSGMQMNLGTYDEEGNLQPSMYQIPPEYARDVIAVPRQEPQYRDRFKWDTEFRYSGNYVALSYSWGNPNDRVPFIIDGHSVDVTRNLQSALRHFREFEMFQKGLWIWVDAVCLDQRKLPASGAGGSVQIQRMSIIYQQAGNILVWLGERDESSDAAIDYLQGISVNYRTEWVEAMDSADPYTAQSHREYAQFALRGLKYKWAGLMRAMAGHLHNQESYDEMINIHNFFARPYWHRLWIIQELAMGHAGMPIICGPTITQWRYIRDGVMLLSSALDVFDELTTCALMERKKKMQEEERANIEMVEKVGKDKMRLGEVNKEEDKKQTVIEQSLLHVATIAQLECRGHRKQIPSVHVTLPLQMNSHPSAPKFGPLMGSQVRLALRLIMESHAFDPRDRIYGMLAIPGIPKFDIEISYSENRTAGDVFTDFARECIRKSFTPDIFNLLDGCGSVKDKYTLPSWCPNFNRVPNTVWGPSKAIGVLADIQIFWAGDRGSFPTFVMRRIKRHWSVMALQPMQSMAWVLLQWESARRSILVNFSCLMSSNRSSIRHGRMMKN